MEDRATGISRFPPLLTATVVLVCLAPSLLNFFGLNFGTDGHAFQMDASAHLSSIPLTDALHYSLAGSFQHTILEWSAFCAALLTAFLAFHHFGVTRDVTTPIVGLALLFAGSMDAFHTLAADRLIETVADNSDLVPLTWAICRLFNALILIVGVGLFMAKRIPGKTAGTSANVGLILLTSAGIGLSAYLIIRFAATSADLPQTTFPGALFTRPFDLVPLALFVLAGLFIYPRFHRAHPSLFSYAIIVSLFPQIVTQLHMAFGSEALFDNHFNIAHFLKIFAYLVPFFGLTLDHMRVYRDEARARALMTAITENTGDAMLTTNSRGQILTANPATRAMFGHGSDHLRGGDIRSLLDDEIGNAVVERILRPPGHKRRIIPGSGGVSLKLELLGNRADGASFPIVVHTGETQMGDETIFTWIIRDISDEREADRAKREFIATISHELRSPLTSIMGGLGLVRGGGTGEIPDAAISMLDIAHSNSARLVRLVNDLLDTEKIETGQMEYEMAAISLPSLIDQAIADSREFGKKRKVAVEVLGEVPDAAVFGNRDRLLQVMGNLLSNAAKFSPENSRVEISAAETGKLVRISVVDRGPGIPEEFHSRIFGKFSQADGSDTRQAGGTGLGLSISKAITEKHGGRIDFETKPGQGTTFHVDLPKWKVR
ncbi:MAG: PAS domain S-box protein [Rhodospirillales bacterium]|nr:PAS domain S-box protein [Rhodospirillales bacterium]